MDIFERSMDLDILPYKDIKKIGHSFNMEVKDVYAVFNEYKDFIHNNGDDSNPIWWNLMMAGENSGRWDNRSTDIIHLAGNILNAFGGFIVSVLQYKKRNNNEERNAN